MTRHTILEPTYRVLRRQPHDGGEKARGSSLPNCRSENQNRRNSSMLTRTSSRILLKDSQWSFRMEKIECRSMRILRRIAHRAAIAAPQVRRARERMEAQDSPLRLRLLLPPTLLFPLQHQTLLANIRSQQQSLQRLQQQLQRQ
jgi:hypothetical protein